MGTEIAVEAYDIQMLHPKNLFQFRYVRRFVTPGKILRNRPYRLVPGFRSFRVDIRMQLEQNGSHLLSDAFPVLNLVESFFPVDSGLVFHYDSLLIAKFEKLKHFWH